MNKCKGDNSDSHYIPSYRRVHNTVDVIDASGTPGILGIALAGTVLPGFDDLFQDKRTPVIFNDLVHDVRFRIFKTVTDKFRHRHFI